MNPDSVDNMMVMRAAFSLGDTIRSEQKKVLAEQSLSKDDRWGETMVAIGPEVGLEREIGKSGKVRNFLGRILAGLPATLNGVVLAVVLLLSLAATTFGIYYLPRAAYEIHPFVGVMAAVVFILVIILLFVQVSKRGFDTLLAKKSPGKLAGFLILLWYVWWAIVSGFSVLSFGLYEAGVVQYVSVRPVSFGTLADYFSWHLLNMVPALEIWATLQIDEPVHATGFGASFLLLVFRILIIVVFFGLIKMWLDQRKKKTVPTA